MTVAHVSEQRWVNEENIGDKIDNINLLDSQCCGFK